MTDFSHATQSGPIAVSLRPDVSNLARSYRRQWLLLRIAFTIGSLACLVMLVAYFNYSLPEAARRRNPVTQQFHSIWETHGVISYLLMSLALFGLFLGRRQKGLVRLCLSCAFLWLGAWAIVFVEVMPAIITRGVNSNTVLFCTLAILVLTIGINNLRVLRLQANFPGVSSYSLSTFPTYIFSARTISHFGVRLAMGIPFILMLAVFYALLGLLLENIYAYSYTKEIPTNWLEFTTATGKVPRFDKLSTSIQMIMIVTVLVKLGLVGLLFLHVHTLIRSAWRKSRPTAEELLSKNQAQPITLIRSFADDNKVMYGFSFVSWLFRRRVRVEEVLSSLARSIGIVIAIGQPRDRSNPLGAYRSYYSDEAWRKPIVDWMLRSRLIVVIAGETQGLAWELEQLNYRNLLPKTVFIFPADSDEVRQRRFLSICRQALGRPVSLPLGVPTGGKLIAASFSSDSPIAVFGNVQYAEDLRAAFFISCSNVIVGS